MFAIVGFAAVRIKVVSLHLGLLHPLVFKFSRSSNVFSDASAQDGIYQLVGRLPTGALDS